MSTDRAAPRLVKLATLRISPEAHSALRVAADRAERSVSAEVRLAVREHLARLDAQAGAVER